MRGFRRAPARAGRPVTGAPLILLAINTWSSGAKTALARVTRRIIEHSVPNRRPRDTLAIRQAFNPAVSPFPVPGFLFCDPDSRGMKTTRKGLREGELEKSTYERLNCAECGESLQTRNDPDEVFSVRQCPECGVEWKELR